MNYAQTLLDPFAGTPATPQAAKSQREYAQFLLGQSNKPVAHWAQGLGNIANALIGGYTDYKANEGERVGQQKAMADFLRGLNLTDSPNAAVSPQQQTPQQPPKFNFGPTPGPQFADIPGMTLAPEAPQPNAVTQNIIRAESGGDPYAKNPRSSATGLGQFIDSTWLQVMKQGRPDLTANKTDAEILAMRNDPQISREMTDVYANQNNQFLTQRGIPVTPQNTHLAHFAGPQGAVNLLRADPNTPVANVLDPKAIAANPFLKNMTVADLLNWAQNKQNPTVQPGVAPAVGPSAANASAGVPQPPPVAPSVDRQMLASVLQNPWANDGIKNAAIQQLLPKDPKIMELGDDKRLIAVDPRTGQPRDITPQGATGPNFKKTQDLRQEVQKVKEYERYSTVVPLVKDMIKASTSNSSTADVSMLYAFAKIMDPESVVREGEYATLTRLQSLPEQVRGNLNKFLSGEASLGPQVRQQLLEMAHARGDQLRMAAADRLKQFEPVVRDNKFNPEHIFPAMYEYPTLEQVKPPKTQQGLPPQIQQQYPQAKPGTDGKLYIPDPNRPGKFLRIDP